MVPLARLALLAALLLATLTLLASLPLWLSSLPGSTVAGTRIVE